MNTRKELQNVAPEAFKAMMDLSKYIGTTSLDPIHAELIKIRASQINGCAYCLNMHTAEARKKGETEQRIYVLSAWRETNLFSEEEKAILALTEEITLISNHLSEATYEKAAALFSEKYLADVLMMIVIINSWNRIAITTALPVN